MHDLRSVLEGLGLGQKGAALYLASLALGETYMSLLAKRAGLKRSTAYVVFKALEDRGLMSSYRGANGQMFVASPPELLVKSAHARAADLEAVLPQLHALTQKSGRRPRIRYYEGKSGYFIAVEDSLMIPHATIRHIGSLTEIHKIIGLDYDLNFYVPARIEKDIHIRCLYYRSEMGNVERRNHAAELREIRYLPESYKASTSSLIYGDRVSIFSAATELASVIIESAEIAETERQKFDLLWDLAGPQKPDQTRQRARRRR